MSEQDDAPDTGFHDEGAGPEPGDKNLGQNEAGGPTVEEAAE
jgi:hypothetical protein